MDEVSSGVYRDEIEGFPYGRARDVMKQCLRLIVAVADNPSMCKFCQSVPIHVFCFWAVGQTTLKSPVCEWGSCPLCVRRGTISMRRLS